MSEYVAERGCITCGDVAIPMRVLEVDRERALALCATDGSERETVEIALVDPVETGEWLLVHAGTALSRAAPDVLPPAREERAA